MGRSVAGLRAEPGELICGVEYPAQTTPLYLTVWLGILKIVLAATVDLLLLESELELDMRGSCEIFGSRFADGGVWIVC